MESSIPSKNRLKSAIVGCGRIGVSNSSRLAGLWHPSTLPVSHAESMIATGRMDLVGFCDPFVEKAQQACAEYQRGAAYGDVGAMLEAQKLDIVSVATRAEARPAIVQLLAESGVRGIYADKPFGRSLAECQAAMQAVQTAGTKLVLGTTRRHNELYRRAYAILTSGKLGKLTQARIQLDPASPLMWAVPHMVDLLVFFSGGQSAVYLQSTCNIPSDAVKGDVIDCDPIVQAVTVLFDNGVYGTMHAGARFGLTLVCEHGEIQVFEGTLTVRVINGPTSSESGMVDELINVSMSGTVRAFVELATAVETNGQSPVSPQDLLFHQSLVVGIAYSSLQGGRRIALAEVPATLTITGKTGELYA